ncbi:MAG: hypothetical protein GQ570_15825 [Helicobacteraceae bacterium]|nr:hypothetical protein [Helicobacteraceae bacterium]
MPNNQLETTTDLSDELQFLIACCQTEASKEDISQIIQHIQHSTFNIQHSISLASSHGILPLVYKTISKLSHDDSSIQNSKFNIQHFLSELKPYYMAIVQKNMLMSAELIRIMKLFEDNNIEALAFKGPALSQMAYGDITLRQYSDLDIYVHRKDMVQISEILSHDRYDSRVELKYFSNDAFLNVNSDVQFYHKNQSVLIEIHWTVFRSAFSNTMKKIDLWENPGKVLMQNYELSTFKTETLLLYLCMHGSKHIWERIEWIVDIDKLIRISSKIDWKEVYRLSDIANGKTMLELGLNLSSVLFQTPLPDEIKKNNTKNKMISQLSSDVLTTLDKKEYFSDTELQKNYRHFRFHLSLRDTVGDKISYIGKTLFPLKSSDIEIINFPKGLLFLYYFLRPFRLLGKYFQKVFTKNH